MCRQVVRVRFRTQHSRMDSRRTCIQWNPSHVRIPRGVCAFWNSCAVLCSATRQQQLTVFSAGQLESWDLWGPAAIKEFPHDCVRQYDVAYINSITNSRRGCCFYLEEEQRKDWPAYLFVLEIFVLIWWGGTLFQIKDLKWLLT